ncbi:hypothetical protein Trydic_g12782 [Trypoxylus dichotomus]
MVGTCVESWVENCNLQYPRVATAGKKKTRTTQNDLAAEGEGGPWRLQMAGEDQTETNVEIYARRYKPKRMRIDLPCRFCLDLESFRNGDTPLE